MSLRALPDAGEQVGDPSLSSTGMTVREVMLRHPKTLSAEASIAEARAVLNNDHVHMVLLTEGSKLAGTLTRTDLPHTEALGPALRWSKLAGRTVSQDSSATVVLRHMIDRGVRRAAVVSADGTLLGLMCLKQCARGFCTEDGVAARS